MAAVAPSTLPKPARQVRRVTAPRNPAGQPPARRPDLRVVAPVRNVRRHVALLLMVAALGVFGVVSLNALAAESAFEAKTLEGEAANLAARYDELTAEVASLESPARVQRIAVEELGMVPAANPGFLAIERESPDEEVALRDQPVMPTLGVQR